MSEVIDPKVAKEIVAQSIFVDKVIARLPNMNLDPSDHGSYAQFVLIDPKSGIMILYDAIRCTITLECKNDRYAFTNAELAEKIRLRVQELRSKVTLDSIAKFTALLDGTVPECQYE